VLAAVNLGDNADTTAAIYGVEAIPERWLELLVMREEIEAVAEGLFRLMVLDVARLKPRAEGGSLGRFTHPGHVGGSESWATP